MADRAAGQTSHPHPSALRNQLDKHTARAIPFSHKPGSISRHVNITKGRAPAFQLSPLETQLFLSPALCHGVQHVLSPAVLTMCDHIYSSEGLESGT